MFGVASQTPSGSIPSNKIGAVAEMDFPTEVVSVVLTSGSTSGDLIVPLRQNFNESLPKVFTFTLTSVVRLPLQGKLYSLPTLK